MKGRMLFVACLLAAPLHSEDLAQSAISPEPKLLVRYPGNHGFIHETGIHISQGWMARYRMDSPGYFIRGRVTGGEVLDPATYEYTFRFALQRGSLGGLLQGANDVVRVEAWDVTADEKLLSRTFQMADFPSTTEKTIAKTLTFSTQGREGHHFEPRVYWAGLTSLSLLNVDLKRLERVTPASLEAKAKLFEQSMQDLHLRRGFVVTRRTNGQEDDTGDAAIWTGLYAASQAWRFQTSLETKALKRMEESLWALHRLHQWSPRKGTLVRYISANGTVSTDPASKDSYTGFFFAIKQCLPVVRDRALRQALLKDVEAIASHFLDNDLSFVPPQGAPMELSPFPSEIAIKSLLKDFQRNPRERRDAVRMLQATQWYFWVHDQRPWPEIEPMIKAIEANDMVATRRLLIPFLNGARRALAQLQENINGSNPALSNPEAPYGKLNLVMSRVLSNFQVSLKGKPIRKLSNARVLPTQSLHALHFVKVAAETLPKPNRFDDFYKANLWADKALLETLQGWNNLDEDGLRAVFGHSRAAAMRNATRHLTFLALFDLIQLEKDPKVSAIYRGLFDQEYGQMQEDYNAMLHAMRAVLGLGPDQVGIGLWSLGRYPLDRRGKGDAYWQRKKAYLTRLGGGEVNNQARDPMPLDLRQRDSFIWQRSARSIRGDDAEKIYPPLDYLFVYWLSRSNRQI